MPTPHTKQREARNSSIYFLRGVGMALEAIRYSTFYYAETNMYILFLLILFCKSTMSSFSIFTVHKFNSVFACE